MSSIGSLKEVIEEMVKVRQGLLDEAAKIEKALGILGWSKEPQVVRTLEVHSDREYWNKYTITVYSDQSATCTCPSFQIRHDTCKHLARKGYSRHV